MNVGDTVRLKSGGPVMTIENIVGDDAHCVWFEGKSAKGRAFSLKSIEPANTGLPSPITVR